MRFAEWLLQETWYHGTQSGDAIRKHRKFKVSMSGGGQRGLRGVWFTEDPEYAKKYADISKSEEGKIDPAKAEVLQADISSSLNIANLNSVEKTSGDAVKAMWEFVGIDIDDDESTAKIRGLQPFALTKLLQNAGYDGALIPNTIDKGGKPELVIFDPKKVSLL